MDLAQTSADVLRGEGQKKARLRRAKKKEVLTTCSPPQARKKSDFGPSK